MTAIHRALSITLLAMLPAIGAARAADDAPSTKINRALRSRDYTAAIVLIDSELKSARGDSREFLLLRRGLALRYAARLDEAIKTLEQQIAEFPAGDWAEKARMHIADVLVAQKKFDAAEKIYAERVRQLVGNDRKTDIAKIYLNFAQEYFQPQDKLTQPSYERARTFYEKALELEPAGALREEILFRRALCNQKLAQFQTAAEQYDAYLLEFDAQYREQKKLRSGAAALPGKAVEGGANWRDARLNLGECLLMVKNYQESRRVLTDLVAILDQSIASAATAKANFGGVTQAWIKAKSLIAQTYQFPNPPDAPNLTSGRKILDELIDAHPESREAIQAQYDIAQAYMSRGWTDAALEEFRALIDRKRIRPATPEDNQLAESLAQDALFKIGRLLLQQKKYADAIGAWNQYVARYPNGPQWAASQQAIVDAEFAIGDDARQDERFDDARQAWNKFLEKYPLDSRANQILLAFGDMAFREETQRAEASASPDWTRPINEWKRLVEKSPASEEAGLAQFYIAQTLEEKVGDLEAAIQAYGKLTWSQYIVAAQERMSEMRNVSLRVVTERTCRSNEKPKIRVDTRNIDKLTVRLYAIDMEDYFRKSKTILGVESLDLLLIDPDKTFEFDVKDFATYKPITQEIELPIDTPSTYAVYVSNEKSKGQDKIKDAGEPTRLQATTLVVKSDIDIIVKTSRGQVLVYAQDMLKKQPAKDVRILAADAKSVLLDGKTDEDGIWVSVDNKIQSADNLTFFASRDHHVAGTGLNLVGLNFAHGLQPRGYIYTDRPAYRPGDSVNIRGILREIQNGAYALPVQSEDKRLRWKVDTVDAKGRTLLSDELALTDFGTFSSLFQISDDAPVGNYKIIARRVDGPAFEGNFRVETFQLAKASLSFEFDERVVMRGTKITGRIVVKYHYGEPVVGKDVEYEIQLPNGDILKQTGRTDDAGKIAFEVETSLLPEEGTVSIVARQAELNIGQADACYVAVRDFTAGLSTPRKLYLSEEPVEIKLETKEIKGDPTSREMTVTAYRRTYERNMWAELKVESTKVKTDEKTGVGRASLKLVKGGNYILRAEGNDANGQTVTAEATVAISDKDDSKRLRIFTDRQTYKVGETLSFDLHSRIEAKDATNSGDDAARQNASQIVLVMCEAEGVFQYKTSTIQPGHNTIDFPIGHEHFPNFKLSVAVMAGNKFYEADRDFTIERELTIKVTPSKSTFKPREEMQVELLVTDQQGKPVAGEIGLAMIDGALLAQYPDSTPNIVNFFQSTARRSADSRSQTSCVFEYRPATTSADLAAAAQRIVDQMGLGQTIAGSPVQGFNGRQIILSQAAPAHDMDSWVQEAETGTPYNRNIYQQKDALELSARRRGLTDDYQMGERFLATEGNGDDGGYSPSIPSGWTLDTIPEGLVESGRTPALAGNEPNASRSTRGYSLKQLLNTKPNFQGRAQVNKGGLGGGRFIQGGGDSLGTYVDADGNLASSQSDDQQLSRERFNRRLQNQVFEYRQSNYKTGSLTNAALDRRLCDMMLAVPPRMYYPEVAYWNPHIITDAEGKASVTIALPDTSTTWSLIARGATKETVVGDGKAEVLSKNDFLVEWTTPPNLIEGDKFTPKAAVHCLVPFSGEIIVKYEALRPNGERVAVGEKKLESKSGGVFDIEFDPIDVPTAEKLVMKLSAESGAIHTPDSKETLPTKPATGPLSDQLTLNIPVRPWGMRIESHAAGVIKDTDFVEIELPPGANNDAAHNLELTIAVGSSMQRWLIEEALESGGRWHAIDESLSALRVMPPRTHADTAAVLLGALYAADYINSNAAAQDAHASADAALLDERIAGLTGQLLAAQNDDGGWPWSGSGGESDPWTTSSVAWAIGKSKYNGHSTSDGAVSRLKAYLQKTFADAPIHQTELKAVVLHGLAWIDQIDFSHANRLYRNREELSTSGLAHLALIFSRLDRKSIAGELLDALAAKSREITRGNSRLCEIRNDGNSAWMQSELEVTALALLAQLQTNPNADRVPQMVAYLASTARADGWRPHKAKGPVIAALATYYARGEMERADYKLMLTVNGEAAGVITSDAPQSLVLHLAGDKLKPGRQRVDFSFSGRGECAYAVTLSGFRPDYPDSRKSRSDYVHVYNRYLQPPQLDYKGRPVRRGFQTASRYDSFTNIARHVPIGTVVSVRTDIARLNDSRTEAPDRDYFVVQENIPAGFRLLADTLRGDFLSHDYANNTLTLYYGNKTNLGELTYDIVATTPGDYRLPPTIARSLYRPDIFHLNQSDQKLAVLERGAASPDEYRMTPDELFDLGRFNFDDGSFKAATDHLKALVNGDWSLEDAIYRDTIRMLLTCALRQSDNDAIVNYFEILKEKYADLVIPFHEIIRVAEAYAATGQAERACVIYRATADSSFLRETAVGGTLQQEGQFLNGIDFLVRLWREYPDTPQVESVFFATSQVLYSRVDTWSLVNARNAAAGQPRPVTRATLLAETIQMLEMFVTLYPESPAADEASYSLVNAYLELDDFNTVVARCDELVKTFPQSKWIDRFRYMQALGYFSLGDFDRALELALKVADSTYVDEQGVVRPSPNKWLALYIAGQIYHAQSNIARAIEYYSKVRDQFSDASEAVENFEEKLIRLPEVTIFHPDGAGFRESEEWAKYLRTGKLVGASGSMSLDDPAAARKYDNPFVQIDYRNLSSAVIQVYRVDLMKLALIEKNLNEITAVNLAGIKPIMEKEVALDPAANFARKVIRVPLEIKSTSSNENVKTDGAYLVICRGGDLFSSGLVLVTPLAVEVQENVGGDRARVSVIDALSRGGVKNVHVKVIGTAMNDFVSGESDLRGMFLAENIHGAPTAIARDTDGHFAFYRSESIEAVRLAERVEAASRLRAQKPMEKKADYRGNLMWDNKAMQSVNCEVLKEVFDKQQRGVQVKSAK